MKLSRGNRLWAPLFIVLLLVLSSLAILSAPPAGGTNSGTSTSHSAVAPTLTPSPSSPEPTVVASTGGHLTLQTIRSTLAKDGVPTQDIHLPALAMEADRRGQPVAPIYHAAPAPMGVADIGLRDVRGNLVGYVLNTSSAEGSITITNAQSVYVDGDGPDMYGVQLNSVVTNVTLFGNSTYQFWTQNFVSYTSSSGELSFGDNIWNFSNVAGLISPNVFYAHGPNGSLAAPVFYYAVGPTFTIHYPFTVTFYLNSTILEDRPAVFFNYTLSNASMTKSGSFDYVIFNSTAVAPTVAARLAMFQINGEQYDPAGLINDIELSVLGNNNGDTTTFFQISATATIAYWNATTDSYWPVPSAVNAGADTGETSDGVASYYLGTSPVAHLGLGPSFLTGLWNSTNPPGIRTMVLTLHPSAALILVNPGTTRNASTAQWVPSSLTGTTTFYFGNTGAWYFDLILSEYTPAPFFQPNGGPNATFHSTGTLHLDSALGIYTPMIAWGNPELATFATSGTGAPFSPYVLYDNEPGPLYPEFTQLNDWMFPVFPGLLLIQTTAYVDVTPPAFTVNYPSWVTSSGYGVPPCDFLQCGLPTTNNLQSEFWNVTNVAVLNSTQISGWLSFDLSNLSYPLGDVIFWNSSDNLVAGNTFYDQGAGLALYGGGSNTVWGNTFVATGTSAANPSDLLGGPSNQTGIWESESGDLLYNNYFSVPSPAFTPTYDPLSCQIACVSVTYHDTWNVSREPASASQTVLGVDLTGSIIGTTYQGGNFWSNYGTPSNPYGVLPYNDSGQVTVGGDYVPLVPFTLYTVTFQETGLKSGVAWGVVTPAANVTGSTTSLVVEDPNGSYAFSVLPPSGYAVAAPAGTFNVIGANVVVTVTFEPVFTATFQESGLPAGYSWSVSLVGPGTGNVAIVQVTSNTSLNFSAIHGSYMFVASSAGYNATPATGTIVLGPNNVVTNITFTLAAELTFTETGLPAGTAWTVALTQGHTTTQVSSVGSTVTFNVFNSATGPYTFLVSASGYNATPASGSGSLPANATQSVVFTARPGILGVTVTPSVSLDFYVDGALAGHLSGSFKWPLAPGTHAIEIVAAGYQPYFNNVTVVAGGTVNLHVTLVPVSSSSSSGVGTLGWELIALLSAVAVILLVTTLIFLRRSRRPPTGTAGGPPQPWSEDLPPHPPKTSPPSVGP
jgi:thermopsin